MVTDAAGTSVWWPPGPGAAACCKGACCPAPPGCPSTNPTVRVQPQDTQLLGGLDHKPPTHQGHCRHTALLAKLALYAACLSAVHTSPCPNRLPVHTWAVGAGVHLLPLHEPTPAAACCCPAVAAGCCLVAARPRQVPEAGVATLRHRISNMAAATAPVASHGALQAGTGGHTTLRQHAQCDSDHLLASLAETGTTIHTAGTPWPSAAAVGCTGWPTKTHLRR